MTIGLKKTAAVIIALLSVLSIFGACKAESKPELLTISFWHTYGGQTHSPMNELVTEFNRTLGREKGIRVEVTLISDSQSMYKYVLGAANKEPGMPELPDVFTAYPKTILSLSDNSSIVDLNEYFDRAELSMFIDKFLDEGRINGKLLVLPFAKSTELLYVNKTAFDRYADKTGASLSSLESWEGLFAEAERYAEFTDAATPDIENDPKAFFVTDYPFHYFETGVCSLGEDIFGENGITFGDAFMRLWDILFKASVKGGVWLKKGYSADPLRTGDAVVSLASSSAALYYPDLVTYPDNSSEQIEVCVLPCPAADGGDHISMQRGAGICVKRSDKKRETAAVTFLKWLTQPHRNTDFAVKTGYIPATREGLSVCLPETIKTLTDKKYVSLYETYGKIYNDTVFRCMPKREDYLSVESRFEEVIYSALWDAREKTANKEKTYEQAYDDALSKVFSAFKTYGGVRLS